MAKTYIHTGPLSKWWKTQSCKNAYKRVEKLKRERLKKFLVSMKARKDKLRKEAEEWEVVD